MVEAKQDWDLRSIRKCESQQKISRKYKEQVLLHEHCLDEEKRDNEKHNRKKKYS